MRGEYLSTSNIGWQLVGSPPHAWGIRMADIPGARKVGSPPHAWGIRLDGARLDRASRFTPTCVGNTHGRRPYTHHQSVHPHMRGEYNLKGSTLGPTAGSPPHAWGIRLDGASLDRASRFTPTCVGNTSSQHFLSSPIAVHPHMRGEYVGSPKMNFSLNGSPPHAWGIR